jgi:hypothetical protein
MFLLPRRQDREIVVKMGARVDDLNAIQVDKDWARFAEYIRYIHIAYNLLAANPSSFS